jgi:hypothetical protein
MIGAVVHDELSGPASSEQVADTETFGAVSQSQWIPSLE